VGEVVGEEVVWEEAAVAVVAGSLL
jgi:hypothetical protein